MTDADLIARLESATKGSRELDAEIELSHRRFLGLAGSSWVANYTLGKGRVLGWLWDGQSLASQTAAPHYTTSLDAALTLVPGGMENHDFDLRRSVRGKADWQYWTLWQARLNIDSVEDDSDETSGQYIGCASTAALVICLAALKAREAAG